MHWNGFRRCKSLFRIHSSVKNQFSMNHQSLNQYFFINTIISFSANFSSDAQFLFFQFVARELKWYPAPKVLFLSSHGIPQSIMQWIHNQGGARYQIILLEDEKFFCFSHVSLWLSHLLRINFKLTVFIFFVFWNINSEIRDPKSRLKRHHKSIENIRRKISSWQNYSHRYHLQIDAEKKRKLNIML